MKPPSIAQAVLAATAPANDYEIIAGDLHEEYLRIRYLSGAKAANRWYWEQVALSIPSLLSYSRANTSALRCISVALVSLAVLVAMLLVLVAIDTAAHTLFGSDRLPQGAWFCINYTDATVSGAILARLVRIDGMRIAFYAALFLVLCFVIPALAGHPGSQAPLVVWIQLLAVIPAMCVGAGFYQFLSRRKGTVN